MNRLARWIALLIALGGTSAAFAQSTGTIQGYCDQGGTQAAVSGLNSTNYLDGVIPKCTITVYLTGTQTKATIFSNGSGTPLPNPFTADVLGSLLPGHYIFWTAVNQGYDVVGSGGIAPNAYSQPVPLLTDVFPGAAGGGGGNCASGITAGDLLFANSSGSCLGSDNIQASGVTGGANGADTLTIKTPSIQSGDDINLILESAVDPSHNNSNFAPHLWDMNCTNSGTSSLGCQIHLNVDDSGRPSPASGGLNPIWIQMKARQNGSSISYTGIEIDQSLQSGVSANVAYDGVVVAGPNQSISETFKDLRGFTSSQDPRMATEEQFGYLAYTLLGATINANYCDFYGRTGALHGGTLHESIGCGPTFASTFYGPVSVQGTGPSSVQIGTNLFSALPACASGAEGTMATVTDSTTNTWGATVTGSGSNHILAYCDGTQWSVMAK